ncbi:FAD-dependent oxidoreductase [Desulfobacula toluolica]|uniref:HdlA9: heterodisulfide reductase-like protein, iron-sulfur subunit n=1 Tax=Desulfobacula toluolica (strain DSM 7467 / Tol2) TaxID=651182 RepID=K0NM11_DESTT|nr:FAD-dependent oxidoreductase [Desulfobacula toluolica]CCK81043.1 HdlA9: heterodisulfide reductase-like protein, iron-sulfur subunit [Desulfobacula toluolica Tol2]
MENISVKKNFGDVMVVGGGISGIQASLDLATSGYKVYLVEKSPTIGGKMAQLDKTFPTNDCSMCIESPKFLECKRHPNIEIMTLTEIKNVEGNAGDFKITLIKKPRYVDEEKCTGCTSCTEYCPIEVSDPFNQNISKNKAVHMFFAQAIPLTPYIDEKCVYLDGERCTICLGICKNDALDFNQAPETIEVHTGAIVLALGIEPFDPMLKNDYGYGIMQNVVTSLDYERLLCATGPYEGEILRASDKKHPHKIAWIHCVGSRRVTPGDNSYCSAVCCTYTQKQVILTKDHDEKVECTIFHNDIRSYSKGFERFYQRTEDLPGIRFIRSYVSVGREIPESKNVTLRYATDEDGVKEEEFDMVVLSVGLEPPADYKDLADKFGIELNAHGFCKINPANPIETTRPGIFVSGAFQGPMDIPESVFTASGACSQCGELLSYRKGRLSKERIYPEERDITGEELKIGVFVCHCGANIGRIVNVPSVVEYALTLPNVVYAQEQLFSCATNSAQEITDMIKEKNLNRVIVAACTPRTHEPVFRDTLREGGINQYLYDMVNIREHCSWVHSKEPEEATQKAKDLLRMSVSRTKHLEPLKEFDLPVNKAAIVVGGGLAGMTGSLSLANQGFEVHLLEKDSQLGGMARRLHTTIDGMDVQAYMNDLIHQVYQNPGIHVSHETVIKDVEGYVGNFVTTVETEGRIKTIKHGAAILATGAAEYKPDEYLYGQNDQVLTQLDLEENIFKNDERLTNAESLVMIQCVGCRNQERNYCSRICCTHAIKNALKLKEINPEMQIYILFRDMRTYGFNEDYYREAAQKDIRFIRYTQKDKPVVEAVDQSGQPVLRVTVPDPVLGRKIELDADLLVLSAAVIPPADIEDVSKLFKVALSPEGFYQEAHVKLRPVDFAAEGVFLCGAAHYPKHISESINQAYGAAGRAAVLLSQDTVTASGSVCEVDEDKCISCGACITACTYGAIQFHDTPKGKKAEVIPVLCKGDGLCNAKCPVDAIFLKHYTDEEILHQVDALFSNPETAIA